MGHITMIHWSYYFFNYFLLHFQRVVQVKIIVGTTTLNMQGSRKRKKKNNNQWKCYE